MTSKDFFICGSLDEGYVYYSKIKNYIRSITDAQIIGTCYRTPVGFPVVLEEGQDSIPGQLLTLELSTVSEAVLDEFQGYNPQNPLLSLTDKKSVLVTKQGFGTTEAITYFLNPAKKTPAFIHIPGGDWRESLQQNPALTSRLTERQKTYIAKLGGCSGRDIVPIDMALYRELMNLELIVDKGRRLALSKLGQEVCRYL